MANALNVDCYGEDISIAHRLQQPQDKAQPPNIVVQFVSRFKRDEWLIAARKKWIQNTDLIKTYRPVPVFVNEHLTAENKVLLGKSKSLVKKSECMRRGLGAKPSTWESYLSSRLSESVVWQRCATDMDGRRGRFNKFCRSTINRKRQPQHILNCNDVVLTIWSSKTVEKINHKTCLCSRFFVILIVMFLD